MPMPPLASCSLHGVRRQRGAISLLAALVLVLAALFTALALDTGRLFLEKRKLQKIADLAALDAAQAMACANDKSSAAFAAAQASALQNGYAGNLPAESGVKLGTVNSAQGLRAFAESVAANAYAVQVETRSIVPASLVVGGWLGGEKVTLKARAVGRSDSFAGISAGSFLARLDPVGLNLLLSGLLGTSVNLDLVSYQGIAAVDLSLLDLIKAQGTVGSVNELLALQMSIGEFFGLMASALSNKGDAATAGYLSVLAAGSTDTFTLALGDLLRVTTEDPEAAAEAKVNVLDLVLLGAEVANGKNAIAIPSAGISVPGGAEIGLSLWVIEPPQIAIGPPGQDEYGNWKTRVQTAQIRLAVDVALLPDPVGIPGILTIQLADLQLAVDAAKTSAWLESIGCPTLGDLDGSATVGSQPGLVDIAIGKLDANGEITGPANVATVEILGLLGGTKIQVGVSAEADLTSDPLATHFDGPFPQTETVGTSLDQALNNALASLANSLNLEVTVGSLNLSLLNQIIGLLKPLLSSVITALGNVLLTPLLEALGVNVGGADLGVFTVRVARPTLVV
ncbi:pilus assembly protein TadG-related protein [Methylocaldum marinum]|nr:pilus assembly protein TadG-related protein [Methylocaldum marinum]